MVSSHVDPQTTRTGGVGRVAACQWKHYSRRYVTSEEEEEEEERFYRRDIFKIHNASGRTMWHSGSRKVLQISLLLPWGEKNINQCLHVKVSVCLTCLICYANRSLTFRSYGSSASTRLLNEKDTVSARKQGSSGEEFCHYTPHWPNVHWKEQPDIRD